MRPPRDKWTRAPIATPPPTDLPRPKRGTPFRPLPTLSLGDEVQIECEPPLRGIITHLWPERELATVMYVEGEERGRADRYGYRELKVVPVGKRRYRAGLYRPRTA